MASADRALKECSCLAWAQVRGVGEADGGSAGGELRVKGPNVFAGYWDKPGATADAFDEDGWFRRAARSWPAGCRRLLFPVLPYRRVIHLDCSPEE